MSELADKASDILLTLARAIDPAAEVKDVREEEDRLYIELEGDGTGVLIGKRGKTLDALQYLTNLITQRQSGELEKPVTVDAEGYRDRRRRQVEDMARETAEAVRKTGREQRLVGLSPADRRHVHLALREQADLATESSGAGEDRVLIVSLAKGGSSR